ncbi:sensor histidine kinase [Hymenobacter weizhouensis]|uniref:sensor histidine kinase n=1 Tax=Hymenobacter sp. YIM 151500-1 TaxID=2987689 RepID=UPI002225E471|nr:histidine kinase [Hymenobacter sp. YIM 151500-1]UYZ62797.1 histidine kinase [Hymenobacter sp. YIM 151500-1]
MSLLTPRQAQTGLLHAVIWVLLGVLLFTQPAGRLPARWFYALQTGLLLVSLGVFYLNAQWAVPQLLYRRRVLLYLALVGAVVLAVTVGHRWVQQALEAHSRPLGLAAGPPPVGSRPPGPPPGWGPDDELGGGPHPGREAGWINPAVLLSTLLVMGLGTSVAAVQRGQHEAQLRQALEQEKLATELSWLKAQLNPHFFFNTLHNIYALTLIDGGQAREAIHRLSRMMRYVLYETQAGTVPLSQEVQFVRDYIELMQLRLTDNVHVHLDLPQPLHEAPMAPLLLLPFIENAFKHGTSALAPSHIRIELAQPTPHTLAVRVRNPVFADRPAALDEGSGIGLANTRRRLALLYPSRHTLTITELTPSHEYEVHLTLTLA